MRDYETTFEYQRLPIGTEFTDEAIDFMKNNDDFVQYYHNYCHNDPIFNSFREMVNERVRLGQISRKDSLYSILLTRNIFLIVPLCMCFFYG